MLKLNAESFSSSDLDIMVSCGCQISSDGELETLSCHNPCVLQSVIESNVSSDAKQHLLYEVWETAEVQWQRQ